MGRQIGLAVLCFLLPPLAVAIKRGVDVQFLINLLLTVLCFWVFGVAHAVFVTLLAED
jgi:uncharacterized membrane protein YqaE (UPF0057 family)